MHGHMFWCFFDVMIDEVQVKSWFGWRGEKRNKKANRKSTMMFINTATLFPSVSLHF